MRELRGCLIAAAAIWIALCCSSVRASVHQYSHSRFDLQGNSFTSFFGGSEGLYASQSPPSAKSGVANGRSYIRFDPSLVFRRKQAAAPQSLQALVFDVSDRNLLGGSIYGGQLDLCCTADLAQEVGCKQGEIIYRNASDGSAWLRIIDVNFAANEIEARMPVEEVSITKTGMYLLYFIYCDPQLTDVEVVSGKTVWKNPSGYLPGRMVNLPAFYAVMSAAYMLLGVVWLAQYVRFWRDILQLQNCITLVIGLGMSEMATWYFDYVNFNRGGSRPVGITLWAVTIGAVKKTVSRMLVLIVSMGYGVVQPTLGGLTSKVLFLGGTFFLASECLDVVEHVGRIDEMSYRLKLLLVLPVAVLDAFFILWIFTSLARTLERLQVKKQTAKLELYRKFTVALAAVVLVAVAWIGFELYFEDTDTLGKHWQSAWIISAFWIVLAFCILCVICTLWAPSQNATRYAYSEEVGEDEESIPLTSTKLPIPTEAVGANLKPERKEKKIVNTDVFRLDEEAGEQDKQE